MVEEINFYSRKKEYGWLSNFDRTPIEVDGVMYQSNEHYYQSQKAVELHTQRWIALAPTAYLAMIAGRSLREGEIHSDWEELKIEFMLKGLRGKFKDPVLRQKLLDTGTAVLHEDSPTDMFWGKKGEDMLGKLLMQVRDELKNAAPQKKSIYYGKHCEYQNGDYRG